MRFRPLIVVPVEVIQHDGTKLIREKLIAQTMDGRRAWEHFSGDADDAWHEIQMPRAERKPRTAKKR